MGLGSRLQVVGFDYDIRCSYTVSFDSLKYPELNTSPPHGIFNSRNVSQQESLLSCNHFIIFILIGPQLLAIVGGQSKKQEAV